MGERTIDDIRGIELLFYQAGAKIQVDGLLFVGHDTIIDRPYADLGPAQPVQRHRGRNVH